MSIDAGPWTSSGALFSDDFAYRYRLHREWNPARSTCTFLMLNPSAANAVKLDPTVRRCIGFAKREGCGRLEVVNVFAWIDSDPNGLLKADDPIGPDNDAHIVDACQHSRIVIAAWSYWAISLGNRQAAVENLIAPYLYKTYVLGRNMDGTPRHPLYMAKTAPLIPYLESKK